MEDRQIVEQIIYSLGGASNITKIENCATRLRATIIDAGKVQESELKDTETVMALIHDRDNYYEIVVGPGTCRRYADICHESGIGVAGVSDTDTKEQQKFDIKKLLKIVGEVFIPLLPAAISAGLCSGIASLITTFIPTYTDSGFLNIIVLFLQLISQSFLVYMTAWVGYSAGQKFGATPILGGMLGMITSLGGINEIAKICGLYNEAVPLNSILMTGKGGVLAVVCGVYFMSIVEKAIKNKMPPSLDMVFTPILTLFICVAPYVFIVMPIFGYLSRGIAWLFNLLCITSSPVSRIITGYLAAALFLPVVATGLHHGLVALYSMQLQTIGYVILYPAFAMAGAGQVGASFAIYRKAKRLGHKKLCSVIHGGLPAGILGIGEPLIYGVTLPMGRPFISAGLGAGFGGALVMLFQVGATIWGTSGILAVFNMTAGPNGPVWSMLYYLLGIIVSYIMSYIITNMLIKDEEVMEALGGIEKEEETSAPANVNHRVVRHGEAVSFGRDADFVFEHIINDSVGIHARPAGEISRLLDKYACDAKINNGEKTASGRSLIQLMSLGAVQGTSLTIVVSGRNAKRAGEALQKLMREKL